MAMLIVPDGAIEAITQLPLVGWPVCCAVFVHEALALRGKAFQKRGGLVIWERNTPTHRAGALCIFGTEGQRGAIAGFECAALNRNQ